MYGLVSIGGVKIGEWKEDKLIVLKCLDLDSVVFFQSHWIRCGCHVPVIPSAYQECARSPVCTKSSLFPNPFIAMANSASKHKSSCNIFLVLWNSPKIILISLTQPRSQYEGYLNNFSRAHWVGGGRFYFPSPPHVITQHPLTSFGRKLPLQ